MLAAQTLLGTSPPTFHSAVGGVMGTDTVCLTSPPPSSLGAAWLRLPSAPPALAWLASEARITIKPSLTKDLGVDSPSLPYPKIPGGKKE